MKTLNKLFNIFMVIAIVLTTFMPPFAIKVNALDGELEQEEKQVDMSKRYKLYMYYGNDQTYTGGQDYGQNNGVKVAVASYDSYGEAKAAMNNITSYDYATAGIEEDGILIDADYALVYMDQPNGQGRTNINEYTYNVYPTAAAARAGVDANKITYVAGSWGVDAAFLEYDANNSAYKVKVSGMVGWIRREKASIHPISAWFGTTYRYPNNKPKVRITATDNIILRSGPGTDQEQVCVGCVAKPGQVYEYTPSKTTKDDTFTWYYVKIDGKEGYIASLNKNWVEVENTLLNDTFYYAYQNNLYHYVHMGLVHPDYYIAIGEAPFYYPEALKKQYYLKNNAQNSGYGSITNRYYSFDSNYFYTNYKDMIDDYRAGDYTKSVNYENPYYAYFMYVPARVKSNVTAEDINLKIQAAGYTSNLTHDASYYYDSNANLKNSLGTESILYGTGEAFVEIANRYGVNPMSVFDAAWRESGNGTSAIALIKKNLFGIGAGDGNAWNGAYVYNTIEESIEAYIKMTGGSGSYTNIFSQYYHGTHKGNKLSGTNVYYMSDPYGGEKDSRSSYTTDLNQQLGMMYSNTLGIKNNNELVKIYAEPNQNSRVIYETKNYATNRVLTNLSFIVTDKVYTYENGKSQGYYRVNTDISLNSNREVDVNTLYNFDYSYGYIKEEDLYVSNHQPVITASNIEMTQFESIDLKAGVNANDIEDGDLTAKISVTGDINIEVPGTYNITYVVSDKSNYSVSKTITVTVNPTEAPIIYATTLEIPQYKDYDEKTGVTVFDNNEGDLTSRLQVLENNINKNVIGEYNVKYSVTNDAGVTSVKNRVVKVIENKKPTINSNDNIVKYLNDSFDYSEYITATDQEDGNITSRMTVTGTVNTQEVGNYTLTCKVKDLDNQETIKYVTVTVEAKPFAEAKGQFQLNKLSYNEETKKVNIMGFLLMKQQGIINESISYSMVIENQQNKNIIIKNLSRMLENQPEKSPIDGYSREWAWFNQELDLSDIPMGNYNVYIRARSGDYETKVPLNDIIFNVPGKDMLRKFEINSKGFEFRTNYFNKYLPIQLFVRDGGLVAKKNNPTTDNIFNQVRTISLDGTKLNIIGSSYNVNADYGIDKTVERTIQFENIETLTRYLSTDVGSVTDMGTIKLLTPDNFDRTRAWYKTTIDVSSLPVGKYAIIVRTKTDEIDDYGELYDMMFSIKPVKEEIGNKRISIKAATDELRFRIELTIENIE